jgi:hypothetical protein
LIVRAFVFKRFSNNNESFTFVYDSDSSKFSPKFSPKNYQFPRLISFVGTHK